MFTSPHATEAIVPELLRTVWEEHQPQGKAAVLWELMQQGSVSGDCFAKVAYEEPYQDPAGNDHPGRIRIIPLNSAFCFPEYYPHDYTRLLRFKLRYRFWGCLCNNTEALTRRGWKHYNEITDDDQILTLDPATNAIKWQDHQGISVYDYDGEMIEWTSGGIRALATPNHRWLGETADGQRMTVRGEFTDEFDGKLVLGGGTPLEFRRTAKWADELVETVAWYICDGSDHVNRQNYHSVHLSGLKPHKIAAWRRLANWWTVEGATFREGQQTKSGQTPFYLGKGVVSALREAGVAPGKKLTPEFICSLTHSQALLLRNTLLAGDGHIDTQHGARWTQLDQGRKDGYQMLSAMLGIRTGDECGEKIVEYRSIYGDQRRFVENRVQYKGKVWCPTVPTGYFMARHEGNTYWTGNTALEGTRQVFTFSELWTEDAYQAFVNDELIESNPNPLGCIPFIHVANSKVPSSPWGMSDIYDITELNRVYNETATEITDIVNYYASPVTVVIGAKSNELLRGAKKVWNITAKDAEVKNLEIGATLDGPLKFLELLKEKMHEIVGIPVNALGQELAISNTSGVALSLQFLPLIQKFRQKTTQYASGFRMLNELIIRTAAYYMPEMLVVDPERDPPLEEGQLSQLDPRDPLTYRNEVEFASPLPIDKLIALNEIQMEMGLGLESKRGALKKLGEPYPAEKLEELLNELYEDMLEQGALDLDRARITALIQALTGITPGQPAGNAPAQAGAAPQPGGDVQSAGGPGVNSTSDVQPGKPAFLDDPEMQQLFTQLSNLSQGTKLPQVRNPLKSQDDD